MVNNMNHSLYNGTGINERMLEDVYAMPHYQRSKTMVDTAHQKGPTHPRIYHDSAT
jgi:hypothetical protein